MDMIEKIQAGTLGGQAYVIELSNGGLVMELSEVNEALTDEQREMIQAMVDELSAGIIDGTIVPLPKDVEATPEPGS